MKTTLRIFALLLLTTGAVMNLSAQDDELVPMSDKVSQDVEKEADVITYTYITDKRYDIIHELAGEKFFPAGYQEGQGQAREIAPGQMAIQLQDQQILIKGVKGLEGFQVVSKSSNRIGYIYELMDAKGKPAKLKVVVDQDKYVNLVYFYSKSLGEHTFYMAEKSKEDIAAEQSYFTSKEQYFIRSYQNLLEKEVVPYQAAKAGEGSPKPIEKSAGIKITFNEENVVTPLGTFPVKKAQTFQYKLKGHPAVRSMIEISLKGKMKKMMVYINFKQQIEVIEFGDTRYFLRP